MTGIETGAFVKAFKGEEGLIVSLLRYGPEGNNEFLLKIENIDHPWNHKIFKLKKHGDDYKAKYWTYEDGVPKGILLISGRDYGGYKVFLKNRSSGIYLKYDEALSGRSVPKDLLDEYLQQLQSGEEEHSTTTSKNEKYHTSPLTAEEKQQYLKTLLRLMEEEKPYLDNTLKLNSLAGLLQVTPHRLSEILNDVVGKKFYDFVNEYRVQAAKDMLEHPRGRAKKLLAIAFEAGFNSKTSFNRVFKELTGMSPSAYREQLENESSRQ